MNSKGNFTQEDMREIDPKKLRILYMKIALNTLIFGFCGFSIGLMLDLKFKQYPIYTIAAITFSFIIVLFLDMIIVKKSIKKNSQAKNGH